MDEELSQGRAVGGDGEARRAGGATGGSADPGLARRITRRGFLGGVGAAGVSLAADWPTGDGWAWAVEGDPASGDVDPAFAAPNVKFAFRRRLDQAIVDIEGYNLEVTTAGDGELQLSKIVSRASAHLVFVFPPQSMHERAFLNAGGPLFGDDPGDELPGNPPVPARIAGPSRIAFSMPAGVLPLPLTSAALFDWLRFTPSLVRNAVYSESRGFVSKLAPPAAIQTAIEMPWWLQLSPSEKQAWAHASGPVTHGGRTELWHTRLGFKDTSTGVAEVSEADDPRRMVRGIWGRHPDFAENVVLDDPPSALSNNVPFRASLTERDRLDVVRLSADFALRGGAYAPPRVEVDRLALTGLGGILDSNFATDLPFVEGDFNSSLLLWRHLGNIGRDQYVRVVRKGWLFPFGFKAVKITITDRVFAGAGGDQTVPRGAYLQQKILVVVTGPIRDFRTQYRVPYNGRNIPFRRIECLTRVTPPLADAGVYATGLSNNEVFQIVTGGKPFPFLIRGLDWAGTTHDFGAMCVFVDDTRAYQEQYVRLIQAAYNGAPADPKTGAANPSDLGGKKVAYAPENKQDDTRYVSGKMRFAAELPSTVAGGPPADPAPPDDPPGANEFARRVQPRFYPALRSVEVRFSEVASAGGQQNPQPSTFSYFGGYLTNGFPSTLTGSGFQNHPNKGQVFFGLPPATGASMLAAATRNSGGMAAPALGVAAVSRELGATGDPDNTSQGGFQPDQVLDDSVKILGGVVLVEVLTAVANFLAGDGDEREKNKKKALTMTSERRTDPNRVVTLIDWEPTLRTGPGPDFLNLFIRLKGAVCKIHVEVVTNLDDPSKSTVDVKGELSNFAISLFGGKSDADVGVDPNDPSTHKTDPLAYVEEPYTFILVPVRRITFTAGSKLKEELHCDIGDISFHGPLKFVEQLSEAMSFGDGSGLKIDVTGDGITIDLTIAIPDITVGVLSLTNIKITVGLAIPFDGSPVRMHFAFCSRENPFTLTVYIFGGGGFVGVVVTTKGLELLEFSFEFGAGFQFSIGGLASGKVEVKAGVYFKVETVEDDQGEETQTLTFEAYIRLDGKLSVLALITVSVHFHLKLIYTKTGNDELLEGEAVLIVEIEVLIFSGSVELKVRKEISKSGGGGFAPSTWAAGDSAAAESAQPALPSPAAPDPLLTFAQNYSTNEWNAYCDAFATAT